MATEYNSFVHITILALIETGRYRVIYNTIKRK